MDRVSAIIPTYDRPQHLAGAIDSVLAQTYPDIEVVVVDDGSETPYAQETVAEYPDSVRCLVHEGNRGLSAARNTGINAAEGEYVAFLDDDDRWEPTKIERQVAALDGSPEAALATCPLAAVDPDGTVLRCEGSKPDGDLSDAILVRNVVGSPSRVLVRADCFETIAPFDESLPTKQDWDLYIRLCQHWEVACVDEHLCRRVVHASMSTDPDAAREDNKRVIDKHESLIRERGLWDRTMAAYYANVGRTYVENDDMGSAREYLRRSLAHRFQPWHAGMYLLTFLGPTGADTVIGAKRRLEQVINCQNVTLAE